MFNNTSLHWNILFIFKGLFFNLPLTNVVTKEECFLFHLSWSNSRTFQPVPAGSATLCSTTVQCIPVPVDGLKVDTLEAELDSKSAGPHLPHHKHNHLHTGASSVLGPHFMWILGAPPSPPPAGSTTLYQWALNKKSLKTPFCLAIKPCWEVLHVSLTIYFASVWAEFYVQ